ncbi:MAG: hypothetical protein D6731_16710 [Planctomycetota bacterium]|nr:MAG: hypothetical protein D6731_16710 [Planctomycetota bacterium]
MSLSAAVARLGAPLGAYAGLTLREGRALGLFFVPLAYAGALGLAALLPAPDPLGRARLLLDLSVALSFGLSALALGVLSARTLAHEAREGIEGGLRVRPVGAWTRPLGKLAGLLALACAICLAHGLLGAAVVRAAAAACPEAPAFLSPARLAGARSGVFRDPSDRRPRPLAPGESFAPTDPARPAWFFDDAPRRGPVELVLDLDVRRYASAGREGSVALAARRGAGEVEVLRRTVFAGRPLRVLVDPPGEGALSVVLHPTGATLVLPREDSLRRVAGRQAFALAYGRAHLGVLCALAVLCALGLFFSATCRVRPALLFVFALGVGGTCLGPARALADALAEEPAVAAQLEEVLGGLLTGEAGEHRHEASHEAAVAPGAWSGVRLLLRATAAALPDLGSYDRRLFLREGTATGLGDLWPDLGRALATVLLWGGGAVLASSLGGLGGRA